MDTTLFLSTISFPSDPIATRQISLLKEVEGGNRRVGKSQMADYYQL